MLRFHEEGITGVGLGPSELTGEIQRKFHQHLFFSTICSVLTQGAWSKACSDLVAFSPAFRDFLGGVQDLWCGT